MNFKTFTTIACGVSVVAAALSGCAEDSTTTPASTNNAANNNTTASASTTGSSSTTGGPTATVSGVTTNTVSGVTSNTVSGVTTNTVGGTTTGTTGGVTVTSAAVTTAAVTSAAVTTATTGGTTGGGATCMAPPATGASPVIDDLEDGNDTILPNEGRKGYWYQFHDAAVAGVQTSSPVSGVPGTGGVFSSTATGYTSYAGFGVSLNANDSTGMDCDYNASVHTGVQFDITTDVAMSFQVAMAATATDSAHFEYVVAAGTSGTVQVPFAMLMQPDWTQLPPVTFNAATIQKLQWQSPNGANYTVTIDNVAFY